MLLMLLVGVVQIAAYYLAGATVRGDHGFAITQPDTLLYCQAAHRIVEGAPFSFSAGEAVCTGTTSVLYPFLLALLDFGGESLILGGFLLNAAFYLIFLGCWSVIVWRFCSSVFSAVTAAALIAFSGQIAFCTLAASDIGLWLVFSAAMAVALVTESRKCFALLLVLAPWVRPEGAVMTIAFAMVAPFLAGKRKCALPLAAIALTSTVGVFAFNFVLTGHAQFSSVAAKGYFRNYPFSDAIFLTAIDSLKILKAYILGIPGSAPRDFHLLPVLGGVFLWLGLLSHDWRGPRRVFTWVSSLGCAGGFATVAMSGWQNTNMDRYLVWVIPFIFLFVGEGVGFLRSLGKVGRLALPAAVALVGYAAAIAVAEPAIAHSLAVKEDRLRSFARQCEDTMVLRAAVGMTSHCGAAYEFSPRRIAHLSGIYSPEFRPGDSVGSLERLKREKALRFYYWFCDMSSDLSLFGAKGWESVSEPILKGPAEYMLRKARWEAFDRAAETPPSPVEGCKLVASLDVGCREEEERVGYEIISAYDQPELKPFFTVADSPKGKLAEGGRVLLGGDEFSVDLTPGKDASVIIRTAASATAYANTATGNYGGCCEFNSPLELHLEIDGEEFGHIAFAVATNGITDAVFKIPGKALKPSQGQPPESPRTFRLGFHGEHIAFGYWFYQ